MPAEPAGDAEQHEPEQCVADGRAVLALHQFLEPFARDRAGIPLRRGEAHFFRELTAAANQAVIAFRDFNWHNEFLAGCLWLTGKSLLVKSNHLFRESS